MIRPDTVNMQQPSCITSFHSDDCMSAQCNTRLYSDSSNSAIALDVLISMNNNQTGKRKRESDAKPSVSRRLTRGKIFATDDATRRLPPKARAKAQRKQTAAQTDRHAEIARQGERKSPCCEMLPPIPKFPPSMKRQSSPLSSTPPSSLIGRCLIERCATFMTAFKHRHPPGSPTFATFVRFVSSQHDSDPVELKRVILHLIALLKPTPSLLWLFYQLLPRWCFTSAHKAAPPQTTAH